MKEEKDEDDKEEEEEEEEEEGAAADNVVDSAAADALADTSIGGGREDDCAAPDPAPSRGRENESGEGIESKCTSVSAFGRRLLRVENESGAIKPACVQTVCVQETAEIDLLPYF